MTSLRTEKHLERQSIIVLALEYGMREDNKSDV